jgi:hypothetical protein
MKLGNIHYYQTSFNNNQLENIIVYYIFMCYLQLTENRCCENNKG